ncbi:glycerophosphodiester phosphodiesterase [Luedemannella flava]|uniref:Glycerophosphodiester phosphodiesterase n=1 Tax=Luedemannella flava TaxID=349316 RepID=A0ABP4XN71_9ACTN
MPPASSDEGAGPLVFAHRGSLPEHTLDAYREAIDAGVDGLECDVRLTRDGHLICIHDRRLDRTSNGRGPVSTSRLADLNELEFGGAPGILTLDTLLTTALDAGRPLRLLIETKHPTRHGAKVERALVAMLERYGLAKADPAVPVQVTVMSFAALALRRVRALAPALPTVYLVEYVPPGVRTARLPFGAEILGPGVGALRAHPDLIRYAHARGRQAYVWTVNSDEDLDLVRRMGADGIITDRPKFVLAALGR